MYVHTYIQCICIFVYIDVFFLLRTGFPLSQLFSRCRGPMTLFSSLLFTNFKGLISQRGSILKEKKIKNNTHFRFFTHTYIIQSCVYICTYLSVHSSHSYSYVLNPVSFSIKRQQRQGTGTD